MSTKRFTCGAPSASAKAARSSLSVSGPNVEKRKRPSAASARAASAKTREGSHHCSARLEKTRSTDGARERQALGVGAHERRPPRARAGAATRGSGRARARASPARCRARRGRRGKALRQRVERVSRAAAEVQRRGGARGASGRGARRGGRTPRAAGRPPRRRCAPRARRRGARRASPGAAPHPCRASRARATLSGWLTKGRCAAVGDFHEARERQRAGEPAARAHGRERVARAVDHQRRAVDRRDLARRSVSRSSASPAREGLVRGRPALDQQRGELAHRARGPAARPARSGSRRLRIVFAGSVAQARREVLQRLARHGVRPVRRAARSRAWRSRGRALAASARMAGGEAHRDQPAERPAAHERPGGHALAPRRRRRRRGPRRATSRECPWPGRSTRCRRNAGVEPRARARRQTPPCSPQPCSSTRSGPLPSRSTCSAIAKGFAQGRDQRLDLLAGMPGREGHAKARRPLAAPSAGGSRERGGPSSRSRAESATARAGIAHDHRLDRGGGGGRDAGRAQARRKSADALVRAWPRCRDPPRSGAGRRSATAAAAGGRAVENT